MKFTQTDITKIESKVFIKNEEHISYSLHRGASTTQRPRITLVHSLAMSREFWQPVVYLLIQHADILTLDVRGHGDSTLSGGKYTAELFADDIAALLTHIGWSSSAIAGASMGGCISLAFAAKYPEKTQALGMLDSTAWYGEDAALKWRERADKALTGGMHALVDFQKTRWFSDSFRENNPSVVDRAVSIFKKTDVNAFANTCQMMGDFDLRHSLAGLGVPTSILVGSEDYATPIEMSELLHSHIAHSTMQVIDKARHLTPIECPQIVCDALVNLLAKSSP